MAGSLTLRVITPDAVVLDEVADTVVFPALDGLMGVLPMHAPMIAALGAGQLEYTSGGQKHQLFVAGGFAEVRNDTLRVITAAGERPSEIDVERAERAAERARERLKTRQVDGEDAFDVLRAEASLGRALVRLKLARR